MNDDGTAAPLSRRVPGSTRSGPSQRAKPALSDTDVHRIQAAINAEHANTGTASRREPNTEPIPAVTDSGPGTTQGGNLGATTEPAAKSVRRTKAPRVDESLRATKALQASAELRAAEKPRAAQPPPADEPASATGRLRPEPVLIEAAVPTKEPVGAPEPVRVPEPVRAEEPVLVPEPVRAKQPVIAAEPQRLESRTAWPAGEPAPGTIGWLWPEGTATRVRPGWQRLGYWTALVRWRYRTAALVALGAVVLVAAGLVLSMFLPSAATSTGAHAPTTAPKAGTHATAKTPKRHATKRTRGGGSRTGGARNHNVQTRIRTGRQLLASGKVSASAAAESDLRAGAVDQRLLLVIEAIANVEPVDVLGFANPGPGASSPFLQMTLAETDPAASVSAPVYLHQMISLLQAHATFPLVHAQPVTFTDGQKVVQVEYPAPSALTG